jgi:hypothetical protein
MTSVALPMIRGAITVKAIPVDASTAARVIRGTSGRSLPTS